MNKERQNGIDEEFIQNENKDKLPYVKLKEISHKVLNDFRWELDLDSALYYCCGKNDYTLLKKLIDCGANVNHKNVSALTPTIYACIYNSHQCAEILIKHGADVNMKNIFGETALQKACMHNSYECAKLLIGYVSNINFRDLLRRSPLNIAEREPSNKRIVDLLIQNGAHE